MSEHIEGGSECRWYKVRMSEEVFEALGVRVEWGEPDAEGFYTPTIYEVEISSDTVDYPRWRKPAVASV